MAEAPESPGLQLRGGVALAGDTPASGVVAGTADGTGRSLLPRALRRRVTSGALKPRRVQLGDLEAVRHDGVRLRGFDRPLTLFAVPTTRGVATVACYAPAQAPPAVGRACERIAATLTLVRGTQLPVVADAATARRVARVLRLLQRDRGSASERLRGSRDRAGQAAAAATLAAVYANFATGLDGLKVSPAIVPILEGMSDDARAVARGYGDLAARAAAGDAAGYAAAAARVRRAQGALQRSAARLEPAGYRVG